MPVAVAVPLLLAGALVHVVGELWHAAAGWGISFGLAPAHAHGQYQGAYGMGMQLGSMVAPVVVTTLAIGWGVPAGWCSAWCSCCSAQWCRLWCDWPPGPGRPHRTGAGAGRLSAVRQVPGRPAHAGVDLAGW
ncbi:hypothetical protein V2I01_22935 [Micromonospora sp. BRA006-A]|nr:hypothetical protein [Micromonospora sp. BRA006-A]